MDVKCQTMDLNLKSVLAIPQNMTVIDHGHSEGMKWNLESNGGDQGVWHQRGENHKFNRWNSKD